MIGELVTKPKFTEGQKVMTENENDPEKFDEAVILTYIADGWYGVLCNGLDEEWHEDIITPKSE